MALSARLGIPTMKVHGAQSGTRLRVANRLLFAPRRATIGATNLAEGRSLARRRPSRAVWAQAPTAVLMVRLLRALTRSRVHLRSLLHLHLHPHLAAHLHLRVHLLVQPHLRLQHTRLCARGGGRSCNPCTRLVQRCLGACLSWRRKERHHHLGHTRGSREEAVYWPVACWWTRVTAALCWVMTWEATATPGAG